MGLTAMLAACGKSPEEKAADALKDAATNMAKAGEEMAKAGEAGVQAVMEYLMAELDLTMALSGAPDLVAISVDHLAN